MHIRFACEHCGKRLKVDARGAGRRVKCPSCQESVTIPESAEEQTAAQTVAESSSDERQDDSDSGFDNPFSEFVVYDDAELVYADDDDEPASTLRGSRSVDPEKVAVPRRILYMQGVLLGVVAIACFVLGWLVGSAGGGSGEQAKANPEPCNIEGRLTYVNNFGEEIADVGAVVLVVPKEAVPEQKANITGLRPNDPEPGEQSPQLLSLQSIGGVYTRTDSNGKYEVNLPDRGRYFVLFLSHRKQRPTDAQPKPNDLAQLGRYVLPAADLLGRSQYQWREESITGDREINTVFR